MRFFQHLNCNQIQTNIKQARDTNKIQLNTYHARDTNVRGSPRSWGYVHQPFFHYYSFSKRKLHFFATPCCHTYFHPYSVYLNIPTLNT